MNRLTESPPGRIVTFYSYKGGVGRTMALSNVAWIIASNGKRVLVVDWDLESPGVHRYFHPFLTDKELRTSRGVIDMIRDYAIATATPVGHDEDPDWMDVYADVLQLAVSLEWDFPGNGVIDLLPAGQQDASYSQTVSTFDWSSLYERRGGAGFLAALQRNLRQHYDWVLIDSRTGLSDSAGICTVQLPDIVCNCFTMNTQSIDGAAAVAKSIRDQRGGDAVTVLPVPMRVEDAEQVKLEAGRDRARARFTPFLHHADPLALDADAVERYWGDIEIPYKPFYAYEEILAVFGDRARQENSLLASFERLTRVITGGQVGQLAGVDDLERRRWLGVYELPKPTTASTIIVSYSSVDRMWAEWITAELATAGLHLHPLEVDALGPDSPELERLVTGGNGVLVLLSYDYAKSANAAPLWKLFSSRDSGRDFLVPVKLDGMRQPPPFSDKIVTDLAGLGVERAREVLLTRLSHLAYALAVRPDMQSSARFPHTAPAVWNAAQRNTAFTGRSSVIEAIRDRLSERTTELPAQALYGLGGVGKTQIVLEYAHRFKADYDVVWWISAEQPGKVRAGLAGLAEPLGLPVLDSVNENVEAVFEALRQGRPYARWLIVFDNAEDPAQLRGFVPHGPGHVLLTSRNQTWEREAEAIEVDVFPRAESIALLRNRVPTIAREEADALAHRLGDLPLAVEQAGAWLAATATDVSGYLTLLDTQLAQVLEENPPPDYPRTVAATWLLSLDRLRAGTPAAARLLEICAFFGPEPIPTSLLYRDRFVEILLPLDPSLIEPLLVARLIREISRYALARVDSAQRSIELHRLVQVVIRATLEPEQRAENERHVHDVLATANPKDTDEPGNWSVYGELWPHLEPSGALHSRANPVRQLVLDTVRYLWKRYDYDSSLEFAQKTLAIWEPSFGADDPMTLAMKIHVATALRLQALYERARDIDRDAYDRLSATVGARHPYTLLAASGLAGDLRGLGLYAEARELDQVTLDLSRDNFGEDHLRTQMAMNNLGISLRLLGEFRSAQRLDEENLNRRRELLGERHMYTLYTASSYGRSLRDVGEFEESRRVLEPTVAALRETLGDDHPETLRGIKNLAVTLRKIGRFTEAHGLTTDALARATRLHGPNHPDTLACAINLACDQSALGQDIAARDTAQVTYERYVTKLGPDHSFTVAAANNLAIFMRKLGLQSEARPISEATLRRFRASLGPDHPYTLACSVNLGNDLFGLGEHAAARELDEDTYERLRRVLGDDHPDTLAAASNLAAGRRAVGAVGQSRELLESVLGRYRRVLGENHPNTTVARSSGRLDCDIEPPPT